MPPKTQKAMIQEIWQGMYGIPDTDENGLVGSFNEVRRMVIQNRIAIVSLISILVGLGIIDASMTHILIGG